MKYWITRQHWVIKKPLEPQQLLLFHILWTSSRMDVDSSLVWQLNESYGLFGYNHIKQCLVRQSAPAYVDKIVTYEEVINELRILIRDQHEK